MSAATQYLEEAKIEEIARELADKGYTIKREAAAGNDASAPQFDIIAQRGDKLIAIEVKAADRLRSAAPEIARLRQWAQEHGIDEFRLVVAHPPRPVNVVVEGLDEALLVYMMEHTPSQLLDISTYSQVEEVYDVDVYDITVGALNLHIAGEGLVAVNLALGGGDARDGVDVRESFPFYFHVTLDADRQITAAEIEVDTSSWGD